MERGSDTPIPVEIEARLSGLGRGPAIPAGVDELILARAERSLAWQRGNLRWLAGARGIAAAVGVGVALGVVAVALASGRGRVDMVDVLRAAKAGAPVEEVRRLGAAAVSVKREGTRGGGL